MARVKIGNVYPTHKYLMERCAPAGFGLGGNGELIDIDSLSDIDALTNNGWYAIRASSAITVAGHSFETCLLEISMLTENHGWHILRFPGKTQSLIRYKNNGVFGDWEWDNPPMNPGVEYRTTERWNGQPLYTKLVECGNLPNKESAVFAHGSSAHEMVRCFGKMSSGGTIPYRWNDSYISVSADLTNIHLCTNVDFSSQTCMVQIWYTKK